MKQTDAPIAPNAGLKPSAPDHADPYEALDGLMGAVEALCPVWPSRGITSGTRFLL